MRQNKKGSQDTYFQFHRTWGTSNPPPAWSAAVEINQVLRGGRKVYETVYKGYVDVVQLVGTIPYGDLSWKYDYHLRHKSGLDHWVSLPTRAVNRIEPVVLPEQEPKIAAWFEAAPTNVQDTAEKIVRELNRAEELVPATVSCLATYTIFLHYIPMLYPYTISVPYFHILSSHLFPYTISIYYFRIFI
jgi:hypothetical protein